MITDRLLLVCFALLFVYLFYGAYVEPYSYTPDPLLNDLKRQLCILHPKLRDIPLYPYPNETYTSDKRRIFVCLKDPKTGRYYTRNMLVHVICHEYAHVLNKEIGHEGAFPAIFHELLDKATDLGLYDPSIPPLQDYCGHK